MRTHLTQEQAACQRVINNKFTDGLDPLSLDIIDRRARGLEVSAEHREYLVERMLADPRLADHYQLEMMIADQVRIPQRS